MDLDQIKTAWKKTSSGIPVDEGKIKHLMSREGKSAFKKLKRYILRSGIFCMAYFLLVVVFAINTIGGHPTYIPLVEISLFILLIGGIWSFYCYRYLAKIDLGMMDITTFSRYFLRFRRWEKWEWCVKIFAIILIISSCFYAEYNNIMVESSAYIAGFIVGYLLIMVLSVGLGLFIYRQFYWKNLKKVDSALKEVEELQE